MILMTGAIIQKAMKGLEHISLTKALIFLVSILDCRSWRLGRVVSFPPRVLSWKRKLSEASFLLSFTLHVRSLGTRQQMLRLLGTSESPRPGKFPIHSKMQGSRAGRKEARRKISMTWRAVPISESYSFCYSFHLAGVLFLRMGHYVTSRASNTTFFKDFYLWSSSLHPFGEKLPEDEARDLSMRESRTGRLPSSV